MFIQTSSSHVELPPTPSPPRRPSPLPLLPLHHPSSPTRLHTLLPRLLNLPGVPRRTLPRSIVVHLISLPSKEQLRARPVRWRRRERKEEGRTKKSKSPLLILSREVSRLIPCASRVEGGASCDLEGRRRGLVVRRVRAAANPKEERREVRSIKKDQTKPEKSRKTR